MMNHDVFISYSSHDKVIADGICSKLEQSNIRCWIAPRDILGGETYGTAIIDAINNCRIVVVIFSSDSNSSNFVLSEIERAVSKSKIIIPVRIEDIHPSGDMELFLARRHWLDALTHPLDIHYAKLSETIHHLLNKDPGTKPQIDPDTKPTIDLIKKPVYDSMGKPKIDPLNKLKNGFYFIVEKEDPYYLRFRDLELPIAFQNTRSQNEKANIFFSQAEKMFYNLKIEEAIRFYKRVVEEDPKFQNAYLKLALMPWLFPNSSNPEDSFNYCKNGFEVSNNHVIGSFLVYLMIEHHRIEEAKNILDILLKNKGIENSNQLAGLYFLQSRLYRTLKDFEKENENLLIANQVSPFFGPALRQRAKFHIERNLFNEAEAILKIGLDEYSKSRYCRNWLNTRDLLISVYGSVGKNEMTLDLLKENNHIQRLMNINDEPQNISSGIFFEGDIDGNNYRGYLVNGTGFDLSNGFLQDGIDLNDNLFCEFDINKSSEYCIFFDHRFGGTVVRIDNIMFLMKIIQGSNTGSLIQTRNDFKLSGNESGFPNLWFISSNPSVKMINLSEAKSLNLKRV